MAKLEWKYPIEAVHGALKKKVFGAAKRKLANAEGEQYNYSVTYGQRSKEFTTDEIERQTRFKAIAQMVATRRKDISKRVADHVAFKAQTTYKTFTKYLWSVCTAQYNVEHPTT